MYHFRKTFDLASAPARFVIHATADNRYELYVNGRRLMTGPARGDLNHWRFETQDIAVALRPGRNVIAAVVWNFAEEAPMAQVTHETGLLVQGDTAAEAVVNTDRTWKAVRNDAVSLLLIDRASIFHEYFVGGPGEQVDGQRYPWGWEAVEFADTGLGCRHRAHDRRTARDPRHPFALDARAPSHPRDGGSARALRTNRAYGRR